VSVLEVDDVAIRFGGLLALSEFTVRVNEWEIVGLIGPNGAGKTTAFNCITGFYKPYQGQIRYRGRDISTLPPHKRAELGLGRTFQNVGLVKGTTVLENLKTAQHARVAYQVASGMIGGFAKRLEERELAERGDAILELLDLAQYRNKRVGGLSYGILKRLEVGCALATDPDLLLLDEPSSGLGPEEAHELGDRLVKLRRDFAVTVLLIEHHVPLVKAVCDYVYCLNSGRLLAEGTAEEVSRHPEVVAAYLGGEAPQALAATTETPEDAALDAQLHDARGLPDQVADEPMARVPRSPARRTGRPAPTGTAARRAATRVAAAEPVVEPDPPATVVRKPARKPRTPRGKAS